MRILEGLASFSQVPAGAVVSIGNFDGMHRGHHRLLEEAVAIKSMSNAPAVVAVTFEPHPLTVLRPDNVPPRLTPPGLKRELLASCGADFLIELPPSREVLDLTAEQFWLLLRDQVRPAHLVEGATFNFGKGRGGTIARLSEWAAASGVAMRIIEPVTVALLDLLVAPVSSSIIRWLLGNGRVRDAAICLGRAYAIEGEVVPGAKRGREIGSPTANLRCLEQMIPGDGVYAGRCSIEGMRYPAAVSIGTNPTFGENPRTVEAYVIGFQGDLYGRMLRVELVDWQRDQQIFPSVAALKEQIARDVLETRRRFDEDPSRAIAAPAV